MEQCCFPRCKNPTYFGYIGRDICWEHWEQLCVVDSKTEKGLLKKIGLRRNKSGSVVEVRRRDNEEND